jgi:hypothetical protein
MDGVEPEFSDPQAEPANPPIAVPPVAILPPSVVIPFGVRILSGIETGALGAGVMAVWLFGNSWLHGDRLLTAANIWATSIYGSAAMRYFPARPISGLAIHVTMACLAGGLFSAAVGNLKRFPVVFLLGLAAGAAWYFGLVYWNPWIAVYSPQPETFIAYLLFGIVLSRTPSRSMYLAGALS